jgi:hypothetical protein
MTVPQLHIRSIIHSLIRTIPTDFGSSGRRYGIVGATFHGSDVAGVRRTLLPHLHHSPDALD